MNENVQNQYVKNMSSGECVFLMLSVDVHKFIKVLILLY